MILGGPSRIQRSSAIHSVVIPFAEPQALTGHSHTVINGTVIEPDAFDNIYAPIRFSLNEANSAFQLVDDILICPSENRIIRGYGRGEYRIPDGIETLDSHAFYGSNFTSIYIPASVKTLGQNPFAGCNTSADTHASLRAVELSPDNDTLEIRDEILFSKADHRLIWAFVIDPRININ